MHELTSAVVLGRLRVLKGAEEPLAEVHGEVRHLQVGLQEETEALLVDALRRGGADQWLMEVSSRSGRSLTMGGVYGFDPQKK